MAPKLEGTNSEATQRIWELIESDDLDALDEVLAEDVVLRIPGQEETRGIDEYKEYIRTYKEAFPDTSFEVHDMFVDGDVVVTHRDQ
ncbi:ester cyclase [Natrarchaeobius oligotrophus]|nr:nuclear transport factor 2 family protein [Natrarchaeobius chitinivorans]